MADRLAIGTLVRGHRAGPQEAPPIARPTAELQAMVLSRCALALRGGVGAVACLAAVLAPGQHPSWSYAAAAINAAWTIGFVGAVLAARRLTPPVVVTEVLLTGAFCLCQSVILPASVVSAGVSWVAGLVSISMAVANLAYRPLRAVPLCGIVLVCHFVGARRAGAADGGVVTAAIHVLQIGAMAALVALLRAAARLADTVLAGLRHELEVSAAARSHREEETARSDELHGKVLATLTAVATGGILRSTASVRQQARLAAGVLKALTVDARRTTGPATGTATGADGHNGRVALHELLRSIADQAGVRVERHLDQVWTDTATADRMALAVEEALINVGRHAGVDEAYLRLTVRDDAIVAEVEDRGRGFDPDGVGAHKYGLRQVVTAAMARVGGDATIDSGPGLGTRVILRCPA